jgi:hypothetical protein
VSAVAADQREVGGLVGYSDLLNYLVVGAVVLALGMIAGRRVRRHRAGLDPVTGQPRRR